MGNSVEALKQVVREVLGQGPSELFYERVERVLEGAGQGDVALRAACRKVQSMVHLFIDVQKAAELGRRFDHICGSAGGSGEAFDVPNGPGSKGRLPF